MKKGILASFVLPGVLSSVLSSAAFASVSDVRQITGTAQLPELKLGLTPAEMAQVNGVPFRFFSSIELKRRFQPVISKLAADERLGAPLPLDPSKSAFDLRISVKQYRARFCEASLRSMKTGKLTGDQAFLNEMEGLSPRVLGGNDVPQLSVSSPSLEQKLISAVSGQLAASSAALKGENPSKVLGPLEAVDSFGGEHFRLKFKNMAASMSLPMIMTLMTGKDAAFIRTLDCSSHYLDQLMAQNRGALKAKYFHISPTRLAHTLRRKESDAVSAHNLMAKLSAPQLLTLLDTFVQLDGRAMLSSEQFLAKQKAMMAELQSRQKLINAERDAKKKAVLNSTSYSEMAELEFLQYMNREIGDFRDTKHSIQLMRKQVAR